MTPETIANALGRSSRKSNGGFMAQCPCHNDDKASLSIDTGDKGIVVKCFAGCSGADITSILKSRGLWPVPAPKEKRTAVARYNYGPHYKTRFSDKSFSFSHRQNGNWIHTRNGSPIPYNLKEIQAADSFCVVEGEKDADRLMALGIPATTLDAGAGSPVPPELIEAAQDKDVVLIPDNDLPGREYVVRIGTAIFPVAASVKLLKLPGLKEKQDVSDWLSIPCNDKGLLLDLIQQAPRWEPATKDNISLTTATILTPAPAPDNPLTAAIDRLAQLSPLEYDRIRKDEAKALGVRPATLDAAVKAAKAEAEQGNDAPFNEVEPWPEPVNGAELLAKIVATIRRFIICGQETAVAAALWIVMTWFMDVVQVAPLAVISAPEKRCGKTLFLSLIGKLVPRALTSSSITPSALFRSIDLWKPTLLIDETDACLEGNEELRGLINCGHTRSTAYTIRCTGDDHTPTKFNTWGAKALSGIGRLADTLMDRSIILELRRKLPEESVERIRHADDSLFQTLSAKLARFAEDNAEAVRAARPHLPASLNDRAQDNWEPLLAIAMVAGGDWLKTATHAAVTLSGGESLSLTVGAELLADIRDIFQQKGIDRISSTDLIQQLVEDDEKPWATYNRGFQIKPRQIASKLKGYGIHSRDIRFGTHVAKGYQREQFTEAFSRYLPITPFPSATTLQPAEILGLSDFSIRNTDEVVADKKTCKAAQIKDCSVVADKIPPSADVEVFDLTGTAFEVTL